MRAGKENRVRRLWLFRPRTVIEHPPLLVLLADGELHSGEWLAKELGQTRAAVWKGVQRLRAAGIEVNALARRGYRLANRVELLDAQRIRAELTEECRAPSASSWSCCSKSIRPTPRLLAAPRRRPEHGRCLPERIAVRRPRQAGAPLEIAPFGRRHRDVARLDLQRRGGATLPALSLGVGGCRVAGIGGVPAHRESR